MDTIIIKRGGNPPKDRKRFLEVDLPKAVRKLNGLVKLELIQDKHGSVTLYKVKGTNTYVKFIGTTSARGDLASSYKKNLMSKLPQGSRLIVVVTRTSTYPSGSFSSYKTTATKISKVRGVIGIVDISDIENYLPKLLKQQKIGNVIPWEKHRVKMELNKINKDTFTKDDILEMILQLK